MRRWKQRPWTLFAAPHYAVLWMCKNRNQGPCWRAFLMKPHYVGNICFRTIGFQNSLRKSSFSSEICFGTDPTTRPHPNTQIQFCQEVNATDKLPTVAPARTSPNSELPAGDFTCTKGFWHSEIAKNWHAPQQAPLLFFDTPCLGVSAPVLTTTVRISASRTRAHLTGCEVSQSDLSVWIQTSNTERASDQVVKPTWPDSVCSVACKNKLESSWDWVWPSWTVFPTKSK